MFATEACFLVVCQDLECDLLVVCRRFAVRGWRNTVGKFHRDLLSSKQSLSPAVCHWYIICGKHRGVRFHRIRDFKQHCFISIPPTSHHNASRVSSCVCDILCRFVSTLNYDTATRRKLSCPSYKVVLSLISYVLCMCVVPSDQWFSGRFVPLSNYVCVCCV